MSSFCLIFDGINSGFFRSRLKVARFIVSISSSRALCSSRNCDMLSLSLTFKLRLVKNLDAKIAAHQDPRNLHLRVSSDKKSVATKHSSNMTDIANEIDLFLFTYNCGKAGIDPDVFVPRLVKSLPSKLASLYCFGVEEYCSLLDGTSHLNSNKHFIGLNKGLLRALNEKYGNKDTKFHTLAMVHLGAIGLVIITPYSLQFHNIKTASCGCGYLYSSLKGAVGVRLSYTPLGSFDKSVDLTFANAHLSAYEGEYYYNRRNSEVISMMRSLDFGDGFSFLKPGSHSFFMGDLNYRTVRDFKGSTKEVEALRLLQDQSLNISLPVEEMVQKYDELSIGIRNDEVFMGFTEGCIDFQPTYKFMVGTAIYSSKRAPSWCDRILFQSTYRNNSVTKNDSSKTLPRINEYNSIKTILTSDHHPVFLSITIPFEPPEPIISSGGYLKILPNDQVIDHFHRKNSKSVFADTVSGPTQIYVKSTRLDRIVQGYLNPLVDLVFGNSIWLTATPAGRITVFVSALILGSVYIFYG